MWEGRQNTDILTEVRFLVKTQDELSIHKKVEYLGFFRNRQYMHITFQV